MSSSIGAKAETRPVLSEPSAVEAPRPSEGLGFDAVEVPSSREIRIRTPETVLPEQHSLPSPPYSLDIPTDYRLNTSSPRIQSDRDPASWEARGTHCMYSVPGMPLSTFHDSRYHICLAPEVKVPDSATEARHVAKSGSSRRNDAPDRSDTAPGLTTRESSTLSVLKEAYKALVGDGEMPMDDVVAAQELIQEMEMVVTSHLRRRLTK